MEKLVEKVDSSIVVAVISNDTTAVLKYLRNGGDPNFTEDVAKLTLLHHAVVNKSYEVAEILVTFGA